MIYINSSPPIFDEIISIKNKSDFPSALSSTKLYVLDGKIDMSDVSLVVPAGGLYLAGHGLNISSLYSSYSPAPEELPYSMFVSAAGGSGDVFFDKMSLTVTGSNAQLFNLVGLTGLEAIEFNLVNFNNVTSMGTIDNYRQGLENGTGRFGGTPELTLKGEWLGGYRATTTITRDLDGGFTGSLYKAGAGFTMSSRFLSDMNCDLPTNASVSDFSPANFTAPSLHQMRGCIMTRDRQPPASGDNNFFPNLDPEDLVCSWRDNNGLRNTFEGGTLTVSSEAVTTITDQSVFYDVNGTWTESDLQHFSSNTNGYLQNDGANPIEFNIISSLIIEGTANNSLAVKVVKWDLDALDFVDVFTQNTTVNSFSGPRNVALVVLNYSLTLKAGEYVKLQVANLSSTSDVTFENGSYYRIVKR